MRNHKIPHFLLDILDITPLQLNEELLLLRPRIKPDELPGIAPTEYQIRRPIVIKRKHPHFVLRTLINHRLLLNIPNFAGFINRGAHKLVLRDRNDPRGMVRVANKGADLGDLLPDLKQLNLLVVELDPADREDRVAQPLDAEVYRRLGFQALLQGEVLQAYNLHDLVLFLVVDREQGAAVE